MQRALAEKIHEQESGELYEAAGPEAMYSNHGIFMSKIEVFRKLLTRSNHGVASVVLQDVTQ